VLVPTLTYTVYSNYARGNTDGAYRHRAAWGAREWTTDDHRDYGLSTYNFHSDGSGIGYASCLQPMLTVRPGFLSYHDLRGSGLRHLPADTHLFDWLETPVLNSIARIGAWVRRRMRSSWRPRRRTNRKILWWSMKKC
jgi:N,N-dimethylformamidase